MWGVSATRRSRSAERDWQCVGMAEDLAVVLLLRSLAGPLDRVGTQARVGLQPHGFAVCRLGMIDSSKLSRRLLNASRRSTLTADGICRLVFFGENHGGDCRRRWTAMIPIGEFTDFMIVG